LLIAAQPTRGLDVGSIEYIHRQLVEKRDEGVAVLLVSVELDEIMALSDRIAVMYEGQIVGTVDAEAITREELGLLMAGARLREESQQAAVQQDAAQQAAKGSATGD
jgi:simple sugar transport system ATP-binding protein